MKGEGRARKNEPLLHCDHPRGFSQKEASKVGPKAWARA
jgi:hypothetical protein